ncbi:UDP-glucose 4-epimerase GalE [Allorhizobium sp. BGMRC 0089]|uniref:UDP-glucose 4-epimerase GalE n=1 Tax=Allorhizobium sonneratiae TaxID=2934936 RepID=UPI002034816C|nr:UDP-glucose 4-epimerase GalE [Allorhizobium sonneratiae]MCM2291454.1 UDP-glucose 4-epimerase GalE [Allorhizobium sonneratiae]
MAFLITGGAGYIGSHMALWLADCGHDVVVLDRLSTGFRRAVQPSARFYLGDIGDRELLRRIFAENSIEAVFHFAGSIVVSDSIKNPLDYYTNNTMKTCVLIEEIVRAGIGRFIFSSTAAVYAPPVDGRPVAENHPLLPQSPYGQSKVMTETILADTAKAHPDFRYVALRYFNVAGCDRKGRLGPYGRGATHLIKAACEAALGFRDVVQVFGTDYPTCDGTGIRDYIHIDDLIAAHGRALAYLADGGASVSANCGYGEGASVLQVIAAVERVAGCKLTLRREARRPGDAACVVADPSFACQTLNWCPQNPGLDLIVETALNWERRLNGQQICLDAPPRSPRLVAAGHGLGRVPAVQTIQ